MSLHWNKSWLFYGLVFVVFSIKLLNASDLTCDAKDNCKCATGSTFIPEKFICDDEEDCADGSDEKKCEKRECLDTEYKCKNGRCIRKSWTCDNYADCKDGSDEKTALCNITTCASDQFRCYNGICISGTFRCDRERDCLGGEDEHDCIYPLNCSAGYFKCSNLKCIDQSFVCDANDDCGDNTDEIDCGTTCSPGSFTCKSGKCIPGNLKCNGKSDCSDGSDEDSCPTAAPTASPTKPNCASDEFFCDGECKPAFMKCDGDQDCADGTDELSCDKITCASGEDLCDDGKSCIRKYRFCNGRNDCADGSDEKASRCSTTTTAAPTTMFTCGTNEYRCTNSLKCIDKTKVCDKNSDCPSGDDESGCLVNECLTNNGKCSQICHDTKKSYYCSCKHGFKMLGDFRTCEDINECETTGQCSQTCTNSDGSYKCSCLSGYALSPNGRSCFPISGKKEKLLVAVGIDVRSVTHDGSLIKCLVDKNTKNAVAVDVHHEKKIIFWIDAYVGKIFSSVLDSSDIPAKVVASGSSLKDLAIDWITEKLYWLTTSAHASEVHVAELNGTNHKTVLSINEVLHSIAVDPRRGYLYWTSATARKISRAYMNGENKEDVVNTSLKSPMGLTIDFPNEKLFWLDSKMRHIESSDLDGKNRRRIVVDDIRHPFDIAVFGDYVYWSDSFLKTVSSANKFTGKNKSVLISRENITSFVPKGISIQHPMTQPKVANRCKNNGGCSHLCLLTPSGSQCACPGNGILLLDKKNCEMPVKSTTTPKTATTTPSISEDPEDTTYVPTRIFFSKVITTNPEVNARSNSKGSSINPQILGGAIAGAVFILLILIIVIVWCQRKNNTSKMEIHYTAEAGNIKILTSMDGRNPTQSKKDVDRDAYFKFANKNFKEVDVDDDDEEDLDNIGEKQPVFKTFKQQEDEEGLIAQIV